MKTNSGQSLVLFAVSLAALMAFTSLGTDVPALYQQQLYTRRAADTAVRAAVLKYRLSGDADKAQKLGDDIGFENLKMAGFETPDGASGGTTVTVDDNGVATVSAGFTASRPSFFLKVLGIKTLNTSASAGATVNPVAVAVVLDTSGSMVPTGFDSPCYDKTASSYFNCQGQDTDLDKAIVETKKFVRSIIGPTVNVALVTFDYSSDLRQSLTSDFSLIDSAIGNIYWLGLTNTSSGLMTARLELNNANSSTKKFCVLVTDGIPSSSIFFATDPRSDITGIPSWAQSTWQSLSQDSASGTYPLYIVRGGSAQQAYPVTITNTNQITWKGYVTTSARRPAEAPCAAANDSAGSGNDYGYDSRVAYCLNSFSYVDSAGNSYSNSAVDMMDYKNDNALGKEHFLRTLQEAALLKTDTTLYGFYWKGNETNSVFGEPYTGLSLMSVAVNDLDAMKAQNDPSFPCCNNDASFKPGKLFMGDKNDVREAFRQQARAILNS